MRTTDMLIAIAKWLESPNNEALLLAESDDDCLKIVAESCLEAAQSLRVAAEKVDVIEPLADSLITAESIEQMASLASALDSSGDPELKKQASVLDELLLTIAAPPNAYAMRKDLQEARLEDLKKRYEQPRKDLHEANMIGKSEKVLDKSEMVKRIAINERPLSTRTCPDHPGSQLGRVSDNVYMCELDRRCYDFTNGYTLQNGERVPGGEVQLQTSNTLNAPMHSVFDSREGRLGQNR